MTKRQQAEYRRYYRAKLRVGQLPLRFQRRRWRAGRWRRGNGPGSDVAYALCLPPVILIGNRWEFPR